MEARELGCEEWMWPVHPLPLPSCHQHCLYSHHSQVQIITTLEENFYITCFVTNSLCYTSPLDLLTLTFNYVFIFPSFNNGYGDLNDDENHYQNDNDYDENHD